MRYFLPAYLFIYLLAVFIGRSLLVWKRTGINPVVFKRTDSAHDYIARIFTLVFLVIVVVVLVYSLLPNSYRYLMPIGWLEQSVIRWIGVTFLIVSFVWTVIAQTQMGQSWRMGIDAERRTELVSKGLFAVSRNPIFLGIIVTLAGLFLTLPNAVTLLILVLAFVLIQIQVRLEEEFLRRIQGSDYDDYRRRVRRWL